MSPGKETLQFRVWEVQVQRLDAADAALDERLDAATNQRRTLFEQIESLRVAFNDERVSSAKSLSVSAGGGAGVVAVVELIQWLLQSGVTP